MKKIFLILSISLLATACNDDADNAGTDVHMKDPSETHPPSEALPDTMQLLQDSVIVVDSVGGRG